MPSTLANRFVHLNFDVDVTEWLTWAQARGIAPAVAARRFLALVDRPS